MLVKQLEARVRPQPGAAIIDLYGDIDTFAEAALNDAFAEASQGHPSAIVLNFRDVEYINSTGIALIVGLLARARQSGRRMVVFGLNDHYAEIFRITRLAEFMSVFPDEASALADVVSSAPQQM